MIDTQLKHLRVIVKTLTNYLPTIYLKRIKAMFIFSGLKGQLDQIFKSKLFSKPVNYFQSPSIQI